MATKIKKPPSGANLQEFRCAQPGCERTVWTSAHAVPLGGAVYCAEHDSPSLRKRRRRAARRAAAPEPPAKFTGRNGPRVKKLPPPEPDAMKACDFLGAAEEIMPIHECAHPDCTEIIGAELEFCQDHQPPAAFRGQRPEVRGQNAATRARKKKPTNYDPLEEAGRDFDRGDIEGRGIGLVPGDPRAVEALADALASTRGKRPTVSGPEEGAPRPEEFTTRIALWAIGRNRANPRSAVEETKIAELAESLQTHGMLQPVILRPAAADARLEPLTGETPSEKDLRKLGLLSSRAQYELVAGERRALAALKAGWKDVPAVVRQAMSDADALELSIVENDQREDLSAIDRARGYRRWLEETGRTQEELAKVVGRDRTTITNTLRLLDAPESWQQRVNAGQIPPTFVRHVLAYKDAPRVLETLEKKLDEAGKEGQPIETVADWQATVKETVRAKSVPLVKTVHVQGGPWSELRIDKTHPHYAELQVIDFDCGWRKEKRALNAKLASEILTEKAKAWKAKHGKKKKVEDKAGVGKAAARLKAQQDAETHRRRLSDWLDDWKHFLCAQHLHRSASAQQRLALLLIAGDVCDVWENGTVFDRLLDRPPFKVRRPPQQGFNRTPSRVWSIPQQQLATVGSEFLARLLWSEPVRPGKDRTPAPVTRLGGANLDLLCRELSIDLAAEWTRIIDGKQVFAGEPLTDVYFELHTPEQLAELAVEWGLMWEDDVTLNTLALEELHELRRARIAGTFPLPAELAELIQPVRRQKAKGKRQKAKK